MVNLDSKSLLRCASVSRSLYLTFHSSSLLQYMAQLALYGMEDTGSDLSYPDISSLLRDHQRAWELLDWKRTVTIEFPAYCQAYELVAGVFARSDGKNLKIFGLPSRTDDGYTMTRTPDIHFLEFAIDPTQDVVAFLEVSVRSTQRIHLRNISTNAPLGILSFTVRPSHISRPILQFADDRLGLHYTSRIFIWNWQQGSLILDWSRESLPRPISDFVFLSRDAFLVTTTALHVYVINPPSSAILVSSLHLPMTRNDSLTPGIKVHSGPLHARPPAGALFTPSSRERVQVLSVSYGLFLKYTMFVHTSTLLRYIEDYRNEEAAPQLDVPWDLWGPHGTRFLKDDVPRMWLGYAHGQRMIQKRDTESGTEIDVIDFNYVPSSSVNTHTCPIGDNDVHRTTFTRSQPTILPPSTSKDLSIFGGSRSDSPFATEVATSLPYHLSSVTVPFSAYAFMIDDERVIGLQVDESEVKLIVCL
ncbi:hypothetical protein M413DRAFT_450082, partial [Hebeloma cylindrosporum]